MAKDKVPFTLSLEVESPDTARALYRSLLKARASERTEVKRLGTLMGGYSDRSFSDSLHSERWRAEAGERMLDRLLWQLETEMEAAEIKPW